MLPILFRLLTIAGTCTLAALFTRELMRRKAEREEADSNLSAEKPLKIPARKQDESGSAGATGSASNNLDEQRKKREERKATAKESVPQTEEKPGKPAAAQNSTAAPQSAEKDANELRARTLVDNSKQIIANYKQPASYK